MKATSKVFKISLSLALMVFVLTMTPASSFLQIVKPAEAAALTSVSIVPTSNIVSAKTTYDIFFKTATTGTIKIIHMTFPSSFDVSGATKLIEREGIGSGSLSAPSSTTLIYTVTNPVSVAAGTTIRLEIGRIFNSNTAGSFNVGIATENTVPIIIDGPTQSTIFTIKDITGSDIAANTITGDDVSPSFMIRKTLPVGTAGWNPNNVQHNFIISDNDVTEAEADSIFISIMNRFNDAGGCTVGDFDDGFFKVICSTPPEETAQLHYVITKLPPNVVASSLSESSSPFDSSQGSQNVFPPSLP